MLKDRKNKGITLVALVITIVILLVLAGISISVLTNTEIFEKAKDAKQKSKEAEVDQNIKLDEYESEINKYLPEITASTIADATDTEKAKKYYGKSVNYTSANGVTGWKILYVGKMTDSTESTNNIYLIADDYVDVKKLPQSTNENGQLVGSAPENTNTSYKKAASFNNVIANYSTGSVRIRNKYSTAIQQLNKSYFIDNPTFSSEDNNNMKALAYMLDTTAWSTFKDVEGKAAYAIGGPTLEMIMKSYSQKYNVQYKAKAVNATGYQVSKDNGITWADYYGEMLEPSDSLYVVQSSNMWVASPSANGILNVMVIQHSGSVAHHYYSDDYISFRPVVCLNSNVRLQVSGDGFSIK